MIATQIYISDDGYIQVIPFFTPDGLPNYLTVFSGKERQHKIYVDLKDGGHQIEDLISILRKYADSLEP